MELGNEMNIFVVNRGSSTIKCYLYNLQKLLQQPIEPIWKGSLEWKNNLEQLTLIARGKGQEVRKSLNQCSADKALKELITYAWEGKTAVLSSLREIDCVGHRIVHGGTAFSQSTIINPQVKKTIHALSHLAPLHNLPELEAIEILEELVPHTQQIAVFDTAFHRTLSEVAQVYPGPYRWAQEGIRRYGFHGISFQYCVRRAAEILQRPTEPLRGVICHLGSGASLCAVKGNKSIDTTMGFTPLDGLMMDTRCGSIDPGIILHALRTQKKGIDQVAHELYDESGLLGISGFSSDMRDILDKSREGNSRANLALDLYLHRLNSLIGSMVASLQGLDLLIFTAGIGENVPLIRQRVCETFSFLGVQLDQKRNEEGPNDALISTTDSRVQVLVMSTQEAFEIARECWSLSR
jgi:acetate kinase